MRRRRSDPDHREFCARFHEALTAYREQAWKEAYELFRECDAHWKDGPSRFYARRCQAYVELPPLSPGARHPRGWQVGVRTARRAGMLVAALALIAGDPGFARAAAVCEDWIAVAVSVQGGVHTRRVGEPQWVRVRVNDTFCAGDMVRTDPRSRAAIALRTGGLLRLDQNTTLTFSPQSTTDSSWIEMLRGAVHFVSRRVRSLNVLTPFINGAVEGTEFAGSRWAPIGPRSRCSRAG